MRFCKDCKFYNKPGAGVAICMHPKALDKPDVVEGIRAQWPCHGMRSFTCGPAASLFQPKETS